MKTSLKSVTPSNPCTVCGEGHKCSRGDDGLFMCGRSSGLVLGFVFLGKAKGDEQFSMYRKAGDPALNKDDYRPHNRASGAGKPTRNGHATNGEAPSTTDWDAVVAEHVRRMTAAAKAKLAETLGLPLAALALLPIGAGKDYGGSYWSFPELDADHKVIGVTRRYLDGRKEAMAGGHRGLTIPDGWDVFDAGTPLLLPEGASCVLACRSIDLPAVGRPNNTGGVKHLIPFLRRIPENRRPMLVVVGEYDQKPDGSWPGLKGAKDLAAALAAELGKGWVIRWVMPPKGHKDLRDYVVSLNLPADCADAWSVAGAKLLSILGEQYQLAGDASAAPTLSVIDSPTFARTVYKIHWILRGLLVFGQPAVIGGPKKCLKSSLLVALAIAIGMGLSFLDRFQAERPMRVGLFSGESGERTIQDTARNVCRSMGVELENVNVYWGFRLPQLSSEEHLTRLVEIIRENALEVVVFDPVYLCLLTDNPSAQASSMFDMGPLLSKVTQLCLDAGATPIFAHHSIKRPPNPHDPLELEDLAFAGFAEFARQWILLSRREPLDLDAGLHKLWMNTGGSAGFHRCYALDIDEGMLDDELGGRKWEVVSLTGISDAIAGRKDAAEKRREDKEKADDAKVLLALDSIVEEGETPTCTKVRNRAGMSGDKFGRVKERLIAAKLVVVECGPVGVGRPADVMTRKKDGESVENQTSGLFGTGDGCPDCPDAQGLRDGEGDLTSPPD